MTYKLVSGKEVIARVANSFKIDKSDWIVKAPLWLADGLADIDCITSLKNEKEVIDVENYMFKLPTDVKLLIGIRYGDYKLPRIGRKELEFDDSIIGESHSTEYYTINNNGYVETSFESGTVTVYYKQSPVQLDTVWNVYIPLIPDSSKLKIALEWYLVTRILQSGGRVEGYSLRDNVPHTNPLVQWQIHRKKAGNDIINLDGDERAKISRLMRTMLINEQVDEFNFE